ncbi:MAG TPA: alpha/beta hydrolase [Vicinamibacterales bacterium]
MTGLLIAALALPLLPTSEVTLASGLRIHYAQQGPRNGPAIVLLHGYSDSSFSFSRVMPLLPPGWRVIAPDLRGHGASGRPVDGYRMTDLATDVLQLMDALDVPSAVVVGHSMGSFVAQMIAERAPARVTKLVLIGSTSSARNESVFSLRDAVAELSDPVDEQFVREFQYSTVAQPVPEAFMHTAIAISRRMPAATWKSIMQGILDFQPATPRPDIPVLVIGGVRDAVFSVAEQLELASQFPRGRLRLFDDAGHTLHWEQPEVFVRELEKFVR